MIRSLRAELLKLRRPSIIYGAGGSAAALALLATIVTFTTAKARPPRVLNVAASLTTTLGQLAGSGGLSRGFSIAAGVLGLLVFVLFMTSVTTEYGLGTIRAMLTRQPARPRLLAGKLLALVCCVAAALLLAEILSIGAAVALAHARGISTAAWFTGTGLRHAATDYANALITATCYGVTGAAIGVLVRSTPLALGLGIAWLGPVEHILQLSWSNAANWLPGLLFDAIATGGTATTSSYQRALIFSLVFSTVALTIGAASFLRRDVST
jgi:ABC-2 type transport system permease protein